MLYHIDSENQGGVDLCYLWLEVGFHLNFN